MRVSTEPDVEAASKQARSTHLCELVVLAADEVRCSARVESKSTPAPSTQRPRASSAPNGGLRATVRDCSSPLQHPTAN